MGVGNPLLDITTNVEDEFLKKYGLYANDQIMATEKHKDPRRNGWRTKVVDFKTFLLAV